MTLQGELRRDHSAAPPWEYSGRVSLPGGRTWGIRAQVAEEAGRKYFLLEFQLVPGFSAAELEVVLQDMEAAAAARVRREGQAVDDLADDRLPF